MARLQKRAYAKINLFLDVGSPRGDGFHDITTVMRRVALSDLVTVETSADSGRAISITVVGDDEIPAGNDNIAYRAAEKYLLLSGISDSVKIILEKNIPSGAGLGGGSADAAAVLEGLNEIYGALSGEELFGLAEELGSDVPFCLFGRTALCRGRGELINPLRDVREMNIAIAMKERSVSTPDAFRRLDARRSEGKATEPTADALSSLSDYLSGEGDMPASLYNSFEGALGEVEDDISELKGKMASHGARLTLTSGSGPSVFGIFADEGDARECVEELSRDGIRAYYSN
jgi:4-diphosphocytidyl-2-C-methyl-D-erythritol kinase